VERYAAWVHESDEGMLSDLRSRGFRFDTSTRGMGMSLDDVPAPLPEIRIEPVEDWGEYLAYLHAVGVPAGLLADTDPKAYLVLAARIDGENVATAIAFDHDGDCGIFNMSTLPEARRRGIGTALTARHLREAAARGCSTATLQATEMAEGIYASVGFRDLGRFLEYVPADAPDGVSIGFA
jgi:ribosomal protein S18 acetylase RimI-like enzyme